MDDENETTEYRVRYWNRTWQRWNHSTVTTSRASAETELDYQARRRAQRAHDDEHPEPVLEQRPSAPWTAVER
jgi:hypothetical protein